MELGVGDKRVLITGGSKGIGLACARVFLQEGASVVLVSRDAASLAKAARSLGEAGKFETCAANLSLGSERERLQNLYSDIDILVNHGLSDRVRRGDAPFYFARLRNA